MTTDTPFVTLLPAPDSRQFGFILVSKPQHQTINTLRLLLPPASCLPLVTRHVSNKDTCTAQAHKTTSTTYTLLLLPIDLQQLNFELECRVGGYDGWESASAVCIIRSSGQHCLLSQGKLDDAFVPAFDDLANPDLGSEWVAPIATRIEFGPTQQSTDIVNVDGVALLWEVSAISGCDCLDCYAHDKNPKKQSDDDGSRRRVENESKGGVSTMR